MLTIEQFRKQVNSHLKIFLDTKIQHAKAIDPEYGRLLREIRDVVLGGGKRIRAYLIYVAYLGLGGKKVSDLMDIAAAYELMHNFLLMHDDVMDGDLERHGKLNIAGIYGSKYSENNGQLASSMAILAGDIVYGLAHELVLRSNFPPAAKLKSLNALAKMVFEVAGGQAIDIFLAEGINEINLKNLLVMNQYKTASYTTAAPIQIGMLLAGADNQKLTAATKFAIPLGISFQLRDDLLDMESDIRSGRISLPIFLAKKELSTTSPMLPKRAIAQTEKMITEYSNSAHRLLKEVGFAQAAESQLSALIDRFALRNV